MSKVFEACIAKANSPSEAYARLWLPAQPYELSDALDKVRLGDAAMYIEVIDFAAYGYLAPYMDEYVFEGRISSERELAMDELKFMMSDEDAELLSGFADLYGYGRAILLRDNSTITPYGLVERTDHQPMQTQSEQMDQGMEMM